MSWFAHVSPSALSGGKKISFCHPSTMRLFAPSAGLPLLPSNGLNLSGILTGLIPTRVFSRLGQLQIHLELWSRRSTERLRMLFPVLDLPEARCGGRFWGSV